MEPTLTFFECLGIEDSQDANDIFEAIKKAFEKHDLLALLDKLSFFYHLIEPLLNTGKKSGLISLLEKKRNGNIHMVYQSPS